MVDNRLVTGVNSLSLSKMIYTLSSALLVYDLLVFGGIRYFLGLVHKRAVDQIAVATRYGHPMILLFFLLTIVGAILVYRPNRRTFLWEAPGAKRNGRTLESIGLGIATGLVSCIIAAPLLEHPGGMLDLVVTAMLKSFFISPLGVLLLFLLAVCMPVASEMFFRGIVFRTLAEYAGVPAAVIASSLIFAYFWSVLNWPAAIILGVTAATLYYRTRTLIAPVLANVVMTFCSVPTMIAYHWLFR